MAGLNDNGSSSRERTFLPSFCGLSPEGWEKGTLTLGRYVHVPAHSAPPERPPAQPGHSLRPLRGLLHRARSYSGSKSVQGAQRALAGGPLPAPPGLSTPGGPREADIDRYQPTPPRCRALGEVVKRGCRVPGGPPSGLTAPSTPPARLLPVPLPGESSPFPFRDRSRTVESMPHIQIHSRLRHRHSILQILLTALVLARPAWPSRLAWVF